MGRLASLLAAGLFATASARPWSRDEGHNTTATNTTAPTMVNDFADIEPSEELTWVPCFDNPKVSCANLLVPLDYADESAGMTNIAWVKYISVDESAEDIIFNPGGPGQSGLSHVALGAEQLLASFGSQYNLISFEPRGVNNSGPALTCFPGKVEAREAFKQSGSNTVPLQEMYQRSKAHGQYCTRANANTTAKYGGTVAVAQDIMHFVDLRAAEKGTPDSAKLWYYGVSYGTALGQTLAALFPERIGRMVLDGNVYGVQHYTGVLPSDVDDSDAAFHDFFQSCFNAGPEKCTFHGSSTSVEEIENRYLTLLQNLRELPAIHNTDDAPGVITDALVSNQFFSQLYNLVGNAASLAETLAMLEQGLADAAWETYFGPAATGPAPYGSAAAAFDDQEALHLITCIDANKNFPITTYEEYLDVREVFRKESYYAGANSAATNLLLCLGMDITPPPSQQFPGFDPAGTTTSFPILFVNFLRDPITPLSSAQKMSAFFPGSVVLAQNSTGHGMSAAESECTSGWTRAYMAEGTLPPPGTVCQPDVRPFVDTPTKRGVVLPGVYF